MAKKPNSATTPSPASAIGADKEVNKFINGIGPETTGSNDPRVIRRAKSLLRLAAKQWKNN